MATPQDDWMSNLSYDPTKTPEGFDYQNYLNINTDLGAAGIDTPEEAMRHYQHYGANEGRNIGALQTQQGANGGNPNTTLNTTPAAAPVDNWMSDQWYNPNVMPENFDWQRYIGANQDLGQAGIDTQEEAMRHYFNYGQKENRSIGALAPKQSGDLSQEDYQTALRAYRDATGNDRPLTGVNGEAGSDYAQINQWIDQNYIPKGKFVTDYAAAKPMEKFELLNQMQTSSRPPEQLASIRKAWDENKDKPSEMRRLMQEYGVTLGDLSQATGETYSQLNTWVKTGDLLGTIGFSVNRPGAYDKYKTTTTPKYDPNSKVVAGPSTAASREADYLSSQKRAANTFDPVAYAKDPEGYAKKMREQGGLAGLVAEKAAPATGSKEALKITPANFKTEYERISKDPNLTDDQMQAFLTESLKDPIIKEKLGSQLQPVLDQLSKPPREKMLGQIGSQRSALGDKYYQGVYSDPKVMADILEKKGVKSLSDLGQKEKFKTTEAEVQYLLPNGQPAQKFEDGTYGYIDDTGYETGKIVRVNPEEMQKVYGKYESVSADGGVQNSFVPLGKDELATLKDGKYEQKMGTVVINKKTGEELTDTTRQLAYQSSSGGANKKHNHLVVEFTKDGTPVLVATREKAGLGKALQDYGPMLAMALPFALPGLGAALSSGLASAGGSALATGSLANAALTQGLISGGLGSLTGQDFGKSFLSGAVSPVIGSGIRSLLPAGLDPNAAQAIKGAGTGVVKGLLKGEGLDDLLKQGLIGGATSYGIGEATKGLGLTPQQLGLATGVVAPLIQGKKINPVQLINSAITSEIKNQKKETGNASGGLLEGPAPVKVPGNASGMDPRMFTGIAANLMARSM